MKPPQFWPMALVLTPFLTVVALHRPTKPHPYLLRGRLPVCRWEVSEIKGKKVIGVRQSMTHQQRV